MDLAARRVTPARCLSGPYCNLLLRNYRMTIACVRLDTPLSFIFYVSLHALRTWLLILSVTLFVQIV